MRWETEQPRDGRAATPFFRVFGGRAALPAGDALRLAEARGNHRGERRVLSVLMPAVVAVAVFDGLWRLGGGWLAWLGVLPGVFLMLHLLAFGLGGRSPGGAFGRWALVLSGWAGAMLVWGGAAWVKGVACGWLGFVGLNALALLVLGWRCLMLVPGRAGMKLRVGIALAAHGGVLLLGWRWGWPAAVVGGVGVVAFWAWGTFAPGSRLFGPVARRVVGKGVLLTIDDGPDPRDTPAILDLLDAHGVKAVFFVIGDKVRRFPELAREIVARGHELGNHTLSHPQASMWCAGPARTRREIADGQRAIEEVTGVGPRWFRAPVGHRNFFTHPVAVELGLEVVAWSRRGFDTVGTDIAGMVRRLADGVSDGDVLLLHEATPVARELLEALLRELEALGSSLKGSNG